MKFAICNETFQDWPFDKAFACARECGYTGIEFAPFTIEKNAYDITPAKRREIRTQVKEAGLEMIGLHWLLAFTEGLYLTNPDAEVKHKTSEYLSELARLCRDLGGSVMVLGSPQQRNLLPGISHDEGMRHAADVIQGSLKAFEECGVTLAVEPLSPAEGDFLNTAELGAKLVEMVASENCRLHLDVKAMSSEQKPVVDIIRDNAAMLEHFHANDPNLLGPGMGEVEFPPIFQALKDIDYQKWVSVEVFDYSPGAEKIARESMDYMKRCLAKISA